MTLGEDVNLEEFIMAKDDLSGADIKVGCDPCNFHCWRNAAVVLFLTALPALFSDAASHRRRSARRPV
jgi:ATP-dependent 26S proteasome regulatory subunit